MPLDKGTRFRMMTTKHGKKVRLAFRKGTNTVVEAKNMQSGATHTPAEFAADRAKRGKRQPLKLRK